MNSIIRHLGFVCLSGALLAACADAGAPATGLELDSTPASDGVGAELTAGAATTLVQVRFVHGSPTSPAFDVYLGTSTTPLFTGVAFGTATPYAAVAPAGLQLVLRTAGAAATTAPVFSSDVIPAQAGDRISSFAGGLLTSQVATVKFRIQSYTEAFAADQAGHAQVRFVHDSQGVTAASFDVDADGTIEVPAIAPFTASAAAGLAIHRGRGVQLAIDTGAAATRLTSFTLPHDVLAQRGGVFLALVGVPTFVPHDPRGLALLAVGRQTTALVLQNPSVFVLPVIPDTAAVDVFAVGARIGVVQVASGIGFGELASRLQVAPSELGYDLIVTRAAGDGGFPLPLAFASTGPVAAGERYLAIASGFAARGPHVRVTVEHDGFDRTVTANGRIRAVAASPDAPAVDVGQFPPGDGTLFAGLPGLSGLAYRTASAEAGVEAAPSAPLNPGVEATGTASALRFDFGQLTAVDRVFGIVAGAFAPVTGEVGSSFIVVDTPASGAWTATTLSPGP